ncbi:pectinesterase inhibitor [Artemisia annua]|uniref:Pectinesterase inhibitor n=1 Tax=Artemisia annua TaxID=35608 RepID=A0A2U1N3L7_ARTAN|nr:pectinesterase inhibitor [Artemisia annua]
MRFSRNNLFFLLTFVFFLIFLSSTSLTFADLINDICKQTHDPSLCFSSLKSDPRSTNASLTTLGRISIKNAQKTAKAARKLIHSSLNSKNYTECISLYEDAISNIKKCKKALKAHDYGQLSTFVSAAMTDATICDGSFGRGVQGPPQLKFVSLKLQDLGNIIIVIANNLAAGIKIVA